MFEEVIKHVDQARTMPVRLNSVPVLAALKRNKNPSEGVGRLNDPWQSSIVRPKDKMSRTILWTSSFGLCALNGNVLLFLDGMSSSKTWGKRAGTEVYPPHPIEPA